MGGGPTTTRTLYSPYTGACGQQHLSMWLVDSQILDVETWESHAFSLYLVCYQNLSIPHNQNYPFYEVDKI